MFFRWSDTDLQTLVHNHIHKLKQTGKPGANEMFNNILRIRLFKGV